MGYAKSKIEDESWMNNIIIGDKSNFYFFNNSEGQNFFSGNVYLDGANPPESDEEALVFNDYLYEVKISEKLDGFYLVFIDIDFLGNPYDKNNPFPGPFEIKESGKKMIRVWPLN